MAVTLCWQLGQPERAAADDDAQPHDAQAQQLGQWSRSLGWGDFALTSTLMAGTLGLTYGAPELDYDWDGGLLFDGRARHRMRATTDHGRDVAAKVSDALLFSLIAYPVVIDTGVLALGVHREPQAAGRMMVINSQAFLITGFVTQLTKLLTRRHRPDTLNCDPNDEDCYDEPKSFFSGHTSMAFTAAGLTCAHATETPIYGSDMAGKGACFAALGAATAVGSLRIVADKHFSTDVLIGASVGLLAGYVMPKWLHYDLGPEPEVASGERAARHLVAPLGSPSSVGLSYQAIW